jgi:hypothetical protein
MCKNYDVEIVSYLIVETVESYVALMCLYVNMIYVDHSSISYL